MSLQLILREMIVGILLLISNTSFASDICSVTNSQKIGDFLLSEASDGSDIIKASTPYPRNADWRDPHSKLRQEFDGVARKAIAKYVYPNASEVNFTLHGLQTLVQVCPQGKFVVYLQPRSGIREVKVVTNGNKNGRDMRASELFDATKNFSPENLLDKVSSD